MGSVIYSTPSMGVCIPNVSGCGQQRSFIPPSVPLLQSPPLGNINPNQYGPGINSDQTGRPYYWNRPYGQQGYIDPNQSIRPNIYGPWNGMNQYGEQVNPTPYGAYPYMWDGNMDVEE